MSDTVTMAARSVRLSVRNLDAMLTSVALRLRGGDDCDQCHRGHEGRHRRPVPIDGCQRGRGARRPRGGQLGALRLRHLGDDRGGVPHRLPAVGDGAGLAGCRRRTAAVRARDVLAGRHVRADRPDAGGCERVHVLRDVPPVPEQRLRPGRDHAVVAAGIRRAPSRPRR